MQQIARLFKGWNVKNLDMVLQLSKRGKDYNVIGFDFGSEESTAAMLANQKTGYRVIKLAIDNAQHKRMHTSLLRHKCDPSKDRIGDNADAVFRNFGTDAGDYYLHFNVQPDRADQRMRSCGQALVGNPLTYGEAMNAFARMFFEQLSLPEIAASNEVMSEMPSVLLISCPYGEAWTEEAPQYREILSRNLRYLGKPVEKVFMIPQSLAALALTLAERAHQFRDEGINGKDAFVIVDMGAQTSNAVVISDGCVVCERSVRLGGELVERNMLAHALREIEEKTGRAPALRFPEIVTLNQLRVTKEAFYGELGLDSIAPVFTFEALDEKGQKSFEMVQIDEAFMNAVMREMPARFTDGDGSENESSWYETCRAFYTGLKKEIGEMHAQGKISAVRRVILTGGASNMTDVVLEAAEAVFGEGVVERSAEPSYTVSKGLLHIARYAAETERALLRVPKKISEIASDAIGSVGSLYEGIAGTLAEQMEKDVLAVLEKWVPKGAGQPLGSAFAKIGEVTSLKLASGKYDKAVQRAVSGWWKSAVKHAGLKKRINAELADAFGVEIEDFKDVALPEDVIKRIEKSVHGAQIQIKQDDLMTACASAWDLLIPYKRIWDALAGGGDQNKTDHSESWRREKYNNAVAFKKETTASICGSCKKQLESLNLHKRLFMALGDEILLALDGEVEKAGMNVFFHRALKDQEG